MNGWDDQSANALFQESAAAGQRALRSYLDKSQDQFFLQAAVSLELAGKAVLASMHPALLIDKDFDSLLHVCGSGKHAKTPPWRLRTIGAQEVLKRCVQIEPKLNSFLKELSLLAELRNGIIHLGLIPQADARKILIAYAKAIEILLEIGGLDLAKFFQDFASVVQVHLDESVAEVNKIVTEKVVKARKDFETRYASFSETERKAVFASLATTQALPQYEVGLIDCPVCKQQGFLSGQYDVEWDVDYDNEGHPERANPIVTLIGDSFFCPVCGLELQDFTELDAAGVDNAIDIDDVDPSDFYGEPDHNW